VRILIYSPAFYPSVGGIETLVDILAREFARQGHAVKLVTQVAYDDSTRTVPLQIIRRPGFRELLSLVRWCDVFFQPQMSLKGLWPLLIAPKPWVVAHNAWYERADGGLGWQDYLKHLCAQFASGISVSDAVAAHVMTPSQVIPNTYREDVFRLMPEVPRDKDLVFLGRLVSAKGVDLLLDSLAELKRQGVTAGLTVIGEGPEEENLREQAKRLGLEAQIEFAGAKFDDELARMLNAHRILVAPSRWQEPFGIVALEGIACGCVIVGSEGGGLTDAIGPCGVTFPNGDVKALTRALADVLSRGDEFDEYREHADEHLARHRTGKIAGEYLKVFTRAMG
jgi:glycosyltransferase involved in cell wall biosynthesis